jgi:hypothetical protein
VNPIPPLGSGIPISAWLYWLLLGYLEKGDTGSAGSALWYIQQSLPGFMSGSWSQVIAILELLPASILEDHRVWICASIAVEVEGTLVDYGARKEDAATRLQERIPLAPARLGHESRQVVDEYRRGMRDFLEWSDREDHDADAFIALASGRNFLRSARQADIIRHGLSQMAKADPEGVIHSRGLTGSGQRTLAQWAKSRYKNLLQDQGMEMAGVLVSWGLPEARPCLEAAYRAQADDGHRCRALSGALQGSPGFMDWI